ncbi:MAG: sigma 54-interacting transcriptional regulator [Nitrospirae bacterium]|nr:sigma 54-interacting transcriptional regulator [Nitrospirota bacterium]
MVEQPQFMIESDLTRGLYSEAGKVSQSTEPILIIGETGTGKEVLARHIHNRSTRSSGPFIPLNCAAMPETLVESELFGYRKGAFTDAKSDKSGVIEMANGGTLFLDEIAELPGPAQAKFLRVLETGEFMPLGTVQFRRSDFRLVCATNKNLQKDRRDFRDDLFYRVSTFTLFLPPLRDRKDEIPLFVNSFLNRNGREAASISTQAMELLLCYTWPGNIRELRNVMHHALALAENEIRPEHLPKWLLDFCPRRDVMESDDVGAKIACFERCLMQSYLDRGASVGELSKVIGVPQSTVYRKLKKGGVLTPKKAKSALKARPEKS